MNGAVIVDGQLVSVMDEITICDSLRGDSFTLGRFNGQNVIVTANIKDKVGLFLTSIKNDGFLQ